MLCTSSSRHLNDTKNIVFHGSNFQILLTKIVFCFQISFRKDKQYLWWTLYSVLNNSEAIVFEVYGTTVNSIVSIIGSSYESRLDNYYTGECVIVTPLINLNYYSHLRTLNSIFFILFIFWCYINAQEYYKHIYTKNYSIFVYKKNSEILTILIIKIIIIFYLLITSVKTLLFVYCLDLKSV